MRNNRHRLLRLAPLAFVLALTGAAQVFGQDTPETNRIPDGQTVKKFRGVVVKRDSDWFTTAPETGGPQTVVLLSSYTDVKSHKKGVWETEQTWYPPAPPPHLR